MGCFGYICRGCGKSIRGDYHSGGENCVLIHVRSGQELGRVEGHYNEYGGVTEQNKLPEDQRYRGEEAGINSHHEICESEFRMPDSYMKVAHLRILDDKPIDILRFTKRVAKKDLEAAKHIPENVPYFAFMKKVAKSWPFVKAYQEMTEKYMQRAVVTESDQVVKNALVESAFGDFAEAVAQVEHIPEIYARYEELPQVAFEHYSGTVAYHKVCYNRAMRNGTFSLVPSESDPDQSWGVIRKKYK